MIIAIANLYIKKEIILYNGPRFNVHSFIKQYKFALSGHDYIYVDIGEINDSN